MAANCPPCRKAGPLLGLVLLAGTSPSFAATNLPPLPDVTDVPEDRTRFETRLAGFVQADAVPYAQSSEDQIAPVTGEPLNQQRFLIRRARLQLHTRQGPWLGFVEIDGNTVKSPNVGLTAAEISFLLTPTPPIASRLGVLSLGVLRVPFGAETQERELDRLFLERSNWGRAFFPGTYDIGVRAQLRWGALVAQAAVMNGEPLGTGRFTGRDPNAAKDIVGRLGLALARWRLRLDAGVSALTGKGFHPGNTASKDVLVWRDQNEDGLVQISEIQIIPGTVATPSRSFSRFALGADARFVADLPRLGELVLGAEVAWAGNLDRALQPADPVSSGRDQRELGILVSATQDLGRHFVIGIRYDWYNADLDATHALPLQVVPGSAKYSTLALVVAWRWSERQRVALEFDRHRNPDGRDRAGLPTNLPSNTLTLRAQLAF
jgi:hypothetical protein